MPDTVSPVLTLPSSRNCLNPEREIIKDRNRRLLIGQSTTPRYWAAREKLGLWWVLIRSWSI